MKSSQLNCPTSNRLTGLFIVLAVSFSIGNGGCQRAETSTEPGQTSEPKVLANKVQKPVSMAVPSTPGRKDSGYVASGCRLTQVKGRVLADDGRQLQRGLLLASVRWLSLEHGSQITVKHQRGGREFSVKGPGKVLPCAGGEETVILAEGSLQTHAGVGGRPGAEALVSTPFGTLRFADARLELQVSEKGVRLQLTSGDGFWEAEESSRVVPGEVLTRTVDQKRAAEPAVSSCSRSAQQVEEAARAVLEQGGKGLGQRAMAHVRLRRAAGALCASAMASALQQLSEPALHTAWQKLEKARRQFRQIPLQEK